MIVTEQEALKTICQESLQREKPLFCFASGCMAWRWKVTSLERSTTPKGYCGKAGEAISMPQPARR